MKGRKTEKWVQPTALLRSAVEESCGFGVGIAMAITLFRIWAKKLGTPETLSRSQINDILKGLDCSGADVTPFLRRIEELGFISLPNGRHAHAVIKLSIGKIDEATDKVAAHLSANRKKG